MTEQTYADSPSDQTIVRRNLFRAMNLLDQAIATPDEHGYETFTTARTLVAEALQKLSED